MVKCGSSVEQRIHLESSASFCICCVSHECLVNAPVMEQIEIFWLLCTWFWRNLQQIFWKLVYCFTDISRPNIYNGVVMRNLWPAVHCEKVMWTLHVIFIGIFVICDISVVGDVNSKVFFWQLLQRMPHRVLVNDLTADNRVLIGILFLSCFFIMLHPVCAMMGLCHKHSMPFVVHV